MDIFLPQTRFHNYFAAMANIEASSLYSVAAQVSGFHLQDGLTRIRFMEEIKSFISAQMQIIRSAKSEDECKDCVSNLKTERENLLLQDRMLRTGESYIAAAVKFYKKNEKIIGYVITGLQVISAGLQIVGGATIALGSIASGNVIGVVAGVVMVAHGVGNLFENIDKLSGVEHPENIVSNAYMDTAQFLGFDRKYGMLAYQIVDFATSVYGLARFIVKPEKWRLYYWLPGDLTRKISTMTPASMAFEMGKAGKKLYDMDKTYHSDSTGQ